MSLKQPTNDCVEIYGLEILPQLEVEDVRLKTFSVCKPEVPSHGSERVVILGMLEGMEEMEEACCATQPEQEARPDGANSSPFLVVLVVEDKPYGMLK